MPSSSSTRTPRSLLTPAALHILMSLAEGERHGYGIKREVEERTDGSLSLGPGTLYEAIHRMLGSGWIEEAEGTGAPSRGRPRRSYRITDEGRRQMEAELSRLRDIVRYAQRRDLMPETGRTR